MNLKTFSLSQATATYTDSNDFEPPFHIRITAGVQFYSARENKQVKTIG